MRLLLQTSYHHMPWKNGLGTTTEIYRFPEESSSPFQWRISVADVKTSGPFSKFPGVDRTIIQLTGPSMTLNHPLLNGQQTLHSLRPYSFSGDIETDGVVHGEATDFNVMVLRSHFLSKVDSFEVLKSSPQIRPLEDATYLFYCAEGAVKFEQSNQTLVASKHDSILMDEGSFTPHQTSLILSSVSPRAHIIEVLLQKKVLSH